MKILYLSADLGIPILGRKGAAVHVRSMVDAFVRAGHDVTIVSGALDPPRWGPPAPLGGRPLPVPTGRETSAAFFGLKAFNAAVGIDNGVPGAVRRILYNQELHVEIAHRFRSAAPDLIYERTSLYGTAGAALARDLQRPLLLEINAPLSLEQATYRAAGLDPLAQAAERWTARQADAIVAVSAPVAEYARSLGADPERVHVLPNGVDPRHFHPGRRDPEVRKRWGLDHGPVLGFVSGLRPWHGVDALAPLLEWLAPRHPGLQLVIAGEGPARDGLERELQARGLLGHTVFTGWLPHEEMPGLIRQFDVALAPYRPLGHGFYFSPLKLFEYMACGVPVVAAALGQMAGVLRHGETGLLYAPGDAGALAGACERLLSDARLRERLGSAAAAMVHDRYTWDHNAARVTEIALRILEARREGRTCG